VFSFTVLIPSGQEYRIKRVDLKKTTKEYRSYSDFHDETALKLKDMQSSNRHIITAFDATFNPDRFEKNHKKYFLSLHVSKIAYDGVDDGFNVYEVNTTSKLDSPTSFYQFLDAVNKSDWIIAVKFPIEFKREEQLIKSSFTMKVYSNNKDKNSTALVSVDK
jgi:hypothetical protein